MTQPYPIDHDVPIPAPAPRSKYPWAALRPGDRFWVPAAPFRSHRHAVNTLSALAGRQTRLTGAHYTVRRAVAADGTPGVGVWRVD